MARPKADKCLLAPDPPLPLLLFLFFFPPPRFERQTTSLREFSSSLPPSFFFPLFWPDFCSTSIQSHKNARAAGAVSFLPPFLLFFFFPSFLKERNKVIEVGGRDGADSCFFFFSFSPPLSFSFYQTEDMRWNEEMILPGGCDRRQPPLQRRHARCLNGFLFLFFPPFSSPFSFQVAGSGIVAVHIPLTPFFVMAHSGDEREKILFDVKGAPCATLPLLFPSTPFSFFPLFFFSRSAFNLEKKITAAPSGPAPSLSLLPLFPPPPFLSFFFFFSSKTDRSQRAFYRRLKIDSSARFARAMTLRRLSFFPFLMFSSFPFFPPTRPKKLEAISATTFAGPPSPAPSLFFFFLENEEITSRKKEI